MSGTAIAGGCLCGAVRYVATAEPLAVRACWCRLCQYLGGGTATVNVCFPADAVAIDGVLAWHDSVADSGTAMRRGFCPACGTPMVSNAIPRPHLTFLRAGTLDDPGIARPQATIWTEAAPDWACIDPAMAAYPRQLPPVA